MKLQGRRQRREMGCFPSNPSILGPQTVDHSSRMCQRPESSLLKMMNADMNAADSKNQAGLEEKP